MESTKQTELLILYFGHEENCSGNKNPILLLNKKNNDGKNELIVSFLVLLSEKFKKYQTDIQNGKFKNLEDRLRQARHDMYNNATSEKFEADEDTYDAEGNLIETMVPVFQERDIQYKNSLISEKVKNKDEIKLLYQDLILLRNVIRFYLKIEWTKSKTGT